MSSVYPSSLSMPLSCHNKRNKLRKLKRIIKHYQNGDHKNLKFECVPLLVTDLSPYHQICDSSVQEDHRPAKATEARKKWNTKIYCDFSYCCWCITRVWNNSIFCPLSNWLNLKEKQFPDRRMCCFSSRNENPHMI